jgi:hypothetical protein
MGITFDDNNDTNITGGTDGTTVGNDSNKLLVDDVARVSAIYSELTVGTSAVELKVGASRLANRKYVMIRPKDTGLYLGYDSSVTTTTGMALFKDEFLMLPIGVAVWLIASGSGKKTSIGELS